MPHPDPLQSALTVAASLPLRPHIPPDLAARLLCEWCVGVLATAEAITEAAKARNSVAHFRAESANLQCYQPFQPKFRGHNT